MQVKLTNVRNFYEVFSENVSGKTKRASQECATHREKFIKTDIFVRDK